ncbi:MAG: acetyltransferase [Cloacibacillus sp.]
MKSQDKVFLIGAGDHAKVVLSTLEACGVECAGIYDDDPELAGKTLWCIPILGPVSAMPDTADTMAVIAIGANEARKEIASRFKNVCWPVFVHPLGIVHSSIRIGKGSVVFAGCLIESDAVIGDHCIVESTCFVGHDAKVGSFSHLGPKSGIANNCEVGPGAFIGMGAIIRPYVKISENVTVGMGSTVVKNLPPNGTYVGTPARRIMTPVVETD